MSVGIKTIIDRSEQLLCRLAKECVIHHWWTLTAIMLLGAGLRLLRASWESFFSRDGYAYIQAAQTIAATGNWAEVFSKSSFANMPPGFLWLLLLGHGCGLSWEYSGFAVVLLFGVILTGVTYWCVYGLYHRIGYALIAALIIAVSPNLIRLGSLILRELPYFAMVMLAVGGGIWAIRKNNYHYWWWYIIGAVGAMLLRKEGCEILMIPLFWGVLSMPSMIRQRNWRGLWQLTGVLIFTAGAVLIILLPLQYYYWVHYRCQWEVIPRSWLAMIISMFKTAVWR